MQIISVITDEWDSWAQNLRSLRKIVASYVKAINTGWKSLDFLHSVIEDFILNIRVMYAETFENVIGLITVYTCVLWLLIVSSLTNLVMTAYILDVLEVKSLISQ